MHIAILRPLLYSEKSGTGFTSKSKLLSILSDNKGIVPRLELPIYLMTSGNLKKINMHVANCKF